MLLWRGVSMCRGAWHKLQVVHSKKKTHSITASRGVSSLQFLVVHTLLQKAPQYATPHVCCAVFISGVLFDIACVHMYMLKGRETPAKGALAMPALASLRVDSNSVSATTLREGGLARA